MAPIKVLTPELYGKRNLMQHTPGYVRTLVERTVSFLICDSSLVIYFGTSSTTSISLKVKTKSSEAWMKNTTL